MSEAKRETLPSGMLILKMGEKIRALIDRLVEKVRELLIPQPALVPVPIKK